MKSSTAKKVRAATNLPGALIATAVGILFLVLSLKAENRSLITLLIPIVILLVGIIGILINVLKLTKKAPEPVVDAVASGMAAELEAEEKTAVDAGYRDAFTDSSEEITFYMGWCGKMNQSYRMEDASGNVLYEGNLLNFSLLGASEYEFVNHMTGERKNHQIGKTVTTGNNGLSTYSTFRLDGEDVLKTLEKRGMELRISSINPLKPQYTLYKSGAPLFTCEMHPMAKRKDTDPGVRKSSNIIMTTKKEYADIAFICGLIIFRTNTSMASW